MITTAMTESVRRLLVALMVAMVAFLSMGLSVSPFVGAAPAHAGGIGGATGGTGEETGGTSVGGGGSGGTPVDIGGLVQVGDLGNVAGYKHYRYGYNVSGCKSGATAKWDWMNRKVVNGRYVDSYSHTGCDYKKEYEIRIYDNLCVNSAKITIDQMRPVAKQLLNSTQKTAWGRGNYTVAGCDSSRSAKLSANLTPEAFGQYRSRGETRLDVLWIKEYLNADIATGRVKAPTVHSHSYYKTVGTFENYATKNCAGWHDRLTSFEGGISACAGVVPPTQPPTSATPPQTNTPIYTCEVPGAAKIDGKSGLVELLRNGDDYDIKWASRTPTLIGDVENVVGKSTRYEIWNAPHQERNGRPYTGNLFELETGKKDVLGGEWKPDAKGFGKTKELAGIQAGSTLRTYWTTVRDRPMTAQAVWTFEATFKTPSVRITGVDPATGKFTTEKVMVKQRATAECRSGALQMSVMKTMLDDIKG